MANELNFSEVAYRGGRKEISCMADAITELLQ